MSVVAQVLAIVEGLALVVVGILGAFFFRSRRLHGFFLIEPRDEEAVRPWAVYTGFANMVWGIGALVGVLAVNLGYRRGRPHARGLRRASPWSCWRS